MRTQKSTTLIDPVTLKPLVAEVVREVLSQTRTDNRQLPDSPLAYSEPEAASLLGLEPHQLRDARLRGVIRASKITGRRIRYRREDLVAYLDRCPYTPPKDKAG